MVDIQVKLCKCFPGHGSFSEINFIRVFGIDNKAGKNRIDSISERDDGHFLNHFG